MKNDAYTTPEILDVTEIEKAKIQADAETQRVAIVEKEKTARQEFTDRKERWTDGNYPVALSIICCTFIISVMGSSLFYSCRKYPEAAPSAPATPCIESLTVVRVNDKAATCFAGAVLETKQANDHGDVELRCVCKK